MRFDILDKMFRNLILSRDLNNIKKLSMQNWQVEGGEEEEHSRRKTLEVDACLFSRNDKEAGGVG